MREAIIVIMTNSRVLPFFLAFVFAVLPPADAVSGAELTPHIATYSLKMEKVRDHGGFIDAQGSMSIRTQMTCYAWIVTQDLDMTLTKLSGKKLNQKLRFTSWESLEGEGYRFASRRVVDGKPFDSQGWGKLAGGRGDGEVWLEGAEKKEFPLPAGTLFPIGQTTWIIDQARNGKRQIPHKAFDGNSGEKGYFDVVGFIANSKGPNIMETDPLLRRPSWTVLLSYYRPANHSALPFLEIQTAQLDNGVTSRMILDSGNFTTRIDLTKIEALPLPVCR